jgi:hypothetical protein
MPKCLGDFAVTRIAASSGIIQPKGEFALPYSKVGRPYREGTNEDVAHGSASPKSTLVPQIVPQAVKKALSTILRAFSVVA